MVERLLQSAAPGGEQDLIARVQDEARNHEGDEVLCRAPAEPLHEEDADERQQLNLRVHAGFLAVRHEGGFTSEASYVDLVGAGREGEGDAERHETRERHEQSRLDLHRCVSRQRDDRADELVCARPLSKKTDAGAAQNVETGEGHQAPEGKGDQVLELAQLEGVAGTLALGDPHARHDDGGLEDIGEIVEAVTGEHRRGESRTDADLQRGLHEILQDRRTFGGDRVQVPAVLGVDRHLVRTGRRSRGAR